MTYSIKTENGMIALTVAGPSHTDAVTLPIEDWRIVHADLLDIFNGDKAEKIHTASPPPASWQDEGIYKEEKPTNGEEEERDKICSDMRD